MEYLNTAKGKFLKFSNLSLKDKLKTVIYSLTFHLFIFAFRLLGYKNLKKIIDKLIISNIRDEQTSRNIVIHESKIINYATGISIIRPTCLERSLYSYLILGLYGIKCDLKIGINNSTEEFSAHAWIEYEELILNDSHENIRQFTELKFKV